MKLNKILFTLLAAFSILTVSCQVEEQTYEPGEPDLEGCYGVYFPTQEAAGSHTMDPSETPAVEIIVKRATAEDDITVPVNVIVSEEGIFNVPELKFVGGQTEAVLNITFPDAKAGVEYSLTLEITDPEYASIYGVNPTFINYSVIIEKYELMGKALYREDIITALFSAPNLEWEVDVYTKETTPGVYYLANVYDPAAGCPLLSNNPTQYKDSYMVIDASNPQKVIMPFQYMGLIVNSKYGECAVGSYAPEAGFNVTEGVYGTLIDGVITFPADALLFGMELYKDFGFYLANGNEMFRVALPGAILTDYTISLSADHAENGKQPVAFTFGPDVETIKYEAYAGPLSKADIEEKAAELAAATNAKTVTRPEEDAEGNVPDAIVNFEFDKTGEYTIVAVGCDEDGAAQSSTSIILTYVAEDDEKGVPVVISAGLGSAAKYAPQGISSETAVEFYVYGEDIVDVKVGLFSYASLAGNQNACIQTLMESDSAPAEVIATVNEDVYVDVFSGLTPGTEYYLLVWASNGYEQKLIMSDPWTTDGDPLPVYQSFSAADIDVTLLPETSEGYFGTYNYYAQYEGPLREYIGQVTIADSDIPDAGPDESGLTDEYVEITGLFGGLQKDFGIEDDTVIFDYYGGVIYSLENGLGKGTHPQVGEIYVGLCQGYPGGVFVGYSYLMIGGYVDEGYLAFVTAPNYADAGYTINSFFLYAYQDAEYSSGLGYLDYLTDPLLVDPAVDNNGLAPKASAARSTLSRGDLNKINFNLASDINCVETERGRIRSAIDQMRTEKAVQSVGTVTGVKGEWSAPAAEYTTEEAAPQFKNTTSDFDKVNDVNPALYR
ncbi:MAG: hypothetical protein IJZ70_06295 [Bacteroidales bacterium]|nr:hypothetical protein [Bacteroidales bacterium]